MRKKSLMLIVGLLIANFFVISLVAQDDPKQLESKRKKLENEIEYTNKLLDKTKENKSATLNDLRLLNKKIEQRDELVSTLNKEVSFIDQQINQSKQAISSLNDELATLKAEYAKVVYFAYKNKTSYNKLIFLFSASDINQAYQRLRYLDQISEYIKKESTNIKNKEKVKSSELEILNQQLAEKKILFDKENTQLSELEKEKGKKNSLVASLSKKEKQLKAELKEKEKEQGRLKKRIEEIIARETKMATKTKTGTDYQLTPEEKLISDSFISNQGKLPWPVEAGLISETFGIHQHPVLKNVQTKSNGINILTSSETQARAVFAGKVVSITTISPSNIAVIIKHGEYFTVYSNLDQVFVKQGDQVETKQVIGKIHTNLKGKTELHFEIWKGKELQDPDNWISGN